MWPFQKLKESFPRLLLIWSLWFWKIVLIIFHVTKATSASPEVGALYLVTSVIMTPHLPSPCAPSHQSQNPLIFLEFSAPLLLTTCHWPDTRVSVWSWLPLLPSSLAAFLIPRSYCPWQQSANESNESPCLQPRHTHNTLQNHWPNVHFSTYILLLLPPSKNPWSC